MLFILIIIIKLTIFTIEGVFCQKILDFIHYIYFLNRFLLIEVARYIIEIKFGIFSNIEPFEKNNFYIFMQHIFNSNFLDVNTFNTPSWSISMNFILIFFCNFNDLWI